MDSGNAALFEVEIQLPDGRLEAVAGRLIGFEARYNKIRNDLRLLIDTEGLAKWSQKHYGMQIPMLSALSDRYPLVIFHGDVGTGKTATAEGVSNRLASELGKEARLFKLSTRVRGGGNVGEMSELIGKAFDIAAREAGKAKLSFMIIDEADSLASTRTQAQSHHEDKVAVNTLIQKIDAMRRFAGRFVIFLCTNHINFLDPAILRRAAYIEEFKRPSTENLRELLSIDCAGLGFGEKQIEQLVELMGPTGPHKLTFTFSDIRTRVFPDAIARSYPSRALTAQDVIDSIVATTPTRAPNQV